MSAKPKAHSHSHNSQSTKLTPEEEKGLFVIKFCKTTKSFTTQHECHDCGEVVPFVTFRNGGGNVERICMHNIDLNVVLACQPQKNNDDSKYNCQYTDWHRLCEYTTNTEKNIIEWLPDWWNEKKFDCNSSKASLTNGIREIKKLDKQCKGLQFCKKKYLVKCLGIEKINESILEADLRFLYFYRQCLIYWLKLNKSVFWKDKIADYTLKCHGCGLNVYFPTQYSRRLTEPFAKNKMVHLEWVDGDSMKWFVCEWCIGICHSRSREVYLQLQKHSIMYPDRWSGLEHWQQTIFAVGHLDGIKFPLHLGWYNIAQRSWYHGPITSIVDSSKGVIEISPIENIDSDDKKSVRISLKNVDKHQYFLYQRPSTSLSPLFARAADIKLYDREFLKNDEYIIDTTSKNNKQKFNLKTMIREGTDVFANSTVIRIVRKGTLEDTRLQSIKRNKHTFDVLSKLDLIES